MAVARLQDRVVVIKRYRKLVEPFVERFDTLIMRGIMTAIFWFNRPKSPHQTFSGPAEALDWLLNQCEKRGHAVSPSMRVIAHQRLLPPTPIASVG